MRKKLILTLWAIYAAILLFAVGWVAMVKIGWIGYMPPIAELQSPISRYASQVISADGRLMGTWSRNENRVFVGGGFATVKIELPKAWDSLMAERGYTPLADFRLTTDLKPDTPQTTRQHRSRPTARGEGRSGNGAEGASRRRDAQGSERGRRGPPSTFQQHRRSRRFRGNATQDARPQ